MCEFPGCLRLSLSVCTSSGSNLRSVSALEATRVRAEAERRSWDRAEDADRKSWRRLPNDLKEIQLLIIW